jgi:hypothetical protein
MSTIVPVYAIRADWQGTVPTGMSTSGLPSHVLVTGQPNADQKVLQVM